MHRLFLQHELGQAPEFNLLTGAAVIAADQRRQAPTSKQIAGAYKIGLGTLLRSLIPSF